jgi:hypothetical protein
LAEIEDRKNLERWLADKPREVAVAIAARAALRVSPELRALFLLLEYSESVREPQDILSPLLRASLMSWVAANCPTYRIDDKTARTASAEAANAASAIHSAASADAANSAAGRRTYGAWARVAAIDAADVAVAAARSHAVADAAAGAFVADAVVHDRADAWRAVSSDIAMIEGEGIAGFVGNLLATQPLWPGEPPDWALEHWQALKSELLSLDQDWDVWTRWYEDRLYGRPFNEALEVARVSEIAEEEWKQGPAVVNARIKEIEARFRNDASLEEALDAMAGHDRWGAGKRYFERRVAGDESDEEVAADVQTAQLHGQLRRRADEFQERCAGIEENLGWVGEGFEEAVNRFAGSLAGETAELHRTIALLYDHTVELGSYLDFDRDLRTRGAGNQSPLDPNLRRAFESLIRAAAPFVRRFPTARMLDDEAGAFLARAELFEPAQAFVRQAGERAVISPEDVQELLALLCAHTRAGDLAHKAKSRGFLSVRGLLAGIAFYYFGMVGGTVAPQSVLVRPVADLWLKSEREIVALLDSLAPDQRHAILSKLERIKALRPNAPKLEKTRETEDPKRLKDST